MIGYLLTFTTTVIGEKSRIFSILFLRVAIKERVKTIAMSMNIDDKCDWVDFVQVVKVFLQRMDLTMIISSRMPPNTVQIIP